jgi:hypothetical protein
LTAGVVLKIEIVVGKVAGTRQVLVFETIAPDYLTGRK